MYVTKLLQKCYFLILAILTISTLLRAQITFERTCGDSCIDCGYAVEQTTDDGYIIAGIKTPKSGPHMTYAVKTDSLGDTLWTRLYPGYDIDEPTSIVKQTSDGGYVFTGGIDSYADGVYDVSLVKADSIGNMLWLKTYGGDGNDWAHAIETAPDSGFIMTGITHSYGAGVYDVYLIKTDMAGDTMWTRTYGGAGSDAGLSVKNTPDGGYIITGWTDSFGAGWYDVYLIKTDSLGAEQWTRTYGGSGSDGGYSVHCTPDGGYVIAGGTTSYGPGTSAVYLIKVNASGDTLWTRTYGGQSNDHGFSVDMTTDGGYIVIGTTSGYGGVYLIKTDSIGNMIWTRTYGGSYGSSVQQTTDGGYIIAGTKSCPNTDDDFYLIKTDTLGFVGIVENHQGSIFEQLCHSQCSPNPAKTFFTIHSPAAVQSVKIYDVLGKLIKAEDLAEFTNEKQISLKGISSGVYFLKVNTEEAEFIKKLIVTK